MGKTIKGIHAGRLADDVALFAPDHKLTGDALKLMLAFRVRNTQWLGAQAVHELGLEDIAGTIQELTTRSLIIPFPPYLLAVTKKGQLIAHVYLPLPQPAINVLWCLQRFDYTRPFPTQSIRLLSKLGYIERMGRKQWTLTITGRNILAC